MKELKEITPEMRTALRASFPDEAYKQHPTKTFLTTLKAMYVTERLNDVFGIGRWFIEDQTIERTDSYILMRGVFHSLDYNVAPIAQYGGHSTTGTNVEIADGFKSALTDCTSKIASYLEIGIDMFKGNIIVKGGKAQKEPDAKKEDDVPYKVLTEKDVTAWNGKIYGKNQVYVGGVKCQVGEDQLTKLKALPKYTPSEKK